MSVELEKGLYGLVTGNSPQTSAAGRMYPRLPQDLTFPVLRYTRIDAERHLAFSGAVGVNAVTMQLDCMAESYDIAKTLADEVRTILHGYRGALGTLTAHLISLETENDLYEVNGDDVTHWVSQRYRIHTNMD